MVPGPHGSTARTTHPTPSGQIRVAVVDGQAVLRFGLTALLEGTAARVTAEAGTYAEGLAMLLETSFDVAVLGDNLPDGSAVELCRQVKLRRSAARVLLLANPREDTLHDAIHAGAEGWVHSNIGARALATGIELVASGYTLVDTDGARRLVADPTERPAAPAAPAYAQHLTAQQERILELIGEGLTNREIADRMVLSEQTVKNHVTRVLARLGVRGRTQAALLATRTRAAAAVTEAPVTRAGHSRTGRDGRDDRWPLTAV